MSNYSADVLSLPAQQPTLLAYWRFTDAAGATTYVDSSVGGNSLVKNGTITTGSTSLVTGSADTSALFNGSTGYAQTGASISALNFARTAPWAVECIIKMTNTTGEQIIVGNIDASGAFTGWEVSVTGGQLQFILSSAFPSAVIQVLSSSAVISAGNVYHVVFQYSGTSAASGVSMYVNGAFVSATVLHDTLSAGSTTTTQKVTVGSRSSSAPSSQFAGNIQELAVYNGQFFNQYGLNQGVIPRHYGLMLGHLPLANTARGIITGGVLPNVWANVNMVYDCDDSGELNWLATMHKNGEINLLCNVTGEVETYACTASRIVTNLYFGLNIPTGPSQRTDYAPNPTTTFNGPPGIAGASLQARFAASDTGRGNATLYPLDDVGQSRASLNACADGTVIGISNSPLMSWNDFLNSASNAGGDGILKTGIQLMNQKVARIYYLGGNWPSSSAHVDFNFDPASTTASGIASQAAHDFFATMAASCPGVEIVIVGPEIIYGTDGSQSNVVTGPPNAHPPASGDPLVNPVKYAYDLFGYSTGRQSFATILVICAVRGISPFFEVAGLRGAAVINASTGNNSFDGATNSNVSYVRPLYTNTQFVTIANEIYLDAPAGLAKPSVPQLSGLGGLRTNRIQ